MRHDIELEVLSHKICVKNSFHFAHEKEWHEQLLKIWESDPNVTMTRNRSKTWLTNEGLEQMGWGVFRVPQQLNFVHRGALKAHPFSLSDPWRIDLGKVQMARDRK